MKNGASRLGLGVEEDLEDVGPFELEEDMVLQRYDMMHGSVVD